MQSTDIAECSKKLTRYAFPLVKSLSDERFRVFYPTKQLHIAAICKALERLPVTVVIFGSSLTGKCRNDSDIDICISTDDDDNYNRACRLIVRSTDNDVDIIRWENICNSKFNYEVLRGIVIHGKDEKGDFKECRSII